MFRRDPVPTVAPNVLKHVHGAVYISGANTVRPGLQPKSEVANGDMGDHTLPGYSGALYGACKLQLERQTIGGDNSPSALICVYYVYVRMVCKYGLCFTHALIRADLLVLLVLSKELRRFVQTQVICS